MPSTNTLVPSRPTTGVDEHPRKLRRLATAGPSGLGDVVTVIVGGEAQNQTFILHEHLLQRSSKFFENALKPEWREGDEKVVRLPEHTPKSFTVYAKFIMTRFVYVIESDDLVATPIAPVMPATGDNTETPTGHRYSLGIPFNLFILADFLQAADFQDAHLDAFIERLVDIRTAHTASHALPVSGTIVPVYKSLAVDSMMRAFLVDWALYTWGENQYEQDFSVWPVEFVAALLRKAGPWITGRKAVQIDGEDPLDLGKACKYHQHTVCGEECYRVRY